MPEDSEALQFWLRSRGDARAAGPGREDLLGRDAERAQVEQALDAVALAPAGIAIEGEPGIGKTTVWRAAIESARRADQEPPGAWSAGAANRAG